MKKKCKNCQFWENVIRTKVGSCHRHAPIACPVRGSEDDEYQLVWPATDFNDWCGEHNPEPIEEEVNG